MENVELFLVGGSYTQVDDGVVIELFGRTRAGESLVARYYGFRPYFIVCEPTEAQRELLRKERQVVSTDPLTLWVDGKDRPSVKVTVQYPWTVPDFRARYHREGDSWSVLSSDIPFVHRFLYDKGVGLTVRFDAEPEPDEVASRYHVGRVVRVVTTNRDIEPAEAFRPSLTILSFDIENAIRTRTIFTICGTVHRDDKEIGAFRIGLPTTEAGILTAFAEKVREYDPDVITGYNIGGYDLPLLEERAKALNLPPLALGRNGKAAETRGNDRLWRVDGRVFADAWWAARTELHPKQESLQFVAQQLLGEGKLDVDRRNIEAEWQKDPVRVMEYCEHDARLAVRILLRLRSLDKARDLATVANLPMEEGLNGRTSLFVDSILIPRADRKKIGVPQNRFGRMETQIEGGYVHTIRPGLYNWIVVLDFKSMYPNIIISKNLCFTTLAPEGPTVSPSGARFLSVEQRPGLIPEVLRELLTERDAIRQRGRDATSPDLQRYYDGLQSAVKILMNSFYGVLASSFYRFTNPDIGAAITSFGRQAITTIIKTLEDDRVEVVYSDTDSVFVKSPQPTLEGAMQCGQDLARRFTEKGVTFEFQTVYEALFSHGAKKRYVGHTVWPKDDVVIRGYETQRTDTFDYQSAALREVFDKILSGDTQGTLVRARELVAEVQEGRVPVERLVIARTVRPEEQYNASTRENLPFLRVFKQLLAEGFDVIPGMKVAWVVTNARKTPQEIEPWIEGRKFPPDLRPDYSYYAERLAQTLARVTEVFGWNAADLLKGSRQQTLGDSPPTGAAASRDAASLDDSVASLAGPPKRARKSKTLTEFG
ncbi:MAG: DNA polymerase domain-containing protein [Thermoplasmata archaeon]